MKFTSSFKLKLIYVMRINDKAHKGCLKIGEATSDSDDIVGLKPNSKALNDAAHKRIKEYTQTAGIKYDLLHTELSVFTKNKTIHSFSDHEVHKVLLRSGIKKKNFDKKNKSNEWFYTDLETVKKAIKAVKEGRYSLKAGDISSGQSPIIFRPEQQEAIDQTIKRFKNNNKKLWFAKMRFGKTLAALQVVKELEFSRTLIITHRPVVDKGWFEDFAKIFYDSNEYSYGSRTNGEKFEVLDKHYKKSKGKNKYIYFASMQDLVGAKKVGGKFEKHDEIFKTKWDLLIVDEAHEGTQTELGQNVINKLLKKETKILELSGTPFNLFDNYSDDEIYTWDYVMEQQAKKDWYLNHPGDPNPYASLPKMNIFTYDLGKLIGKYEDEDVAFNFHEFFRVDNAGKFIHDKDISSFLDLICKSDKKSNYPYSIKEYRDNFRHSLWMVPGVKEAKALSTKLKKHKVFGNFDIVNVAGDGDEEESREDALKKVLNTIGEKPHETYSITLSCGRLTTGVTVPAWTAVFMLAGSYNTSASAYMQTIFRVQSPATINGRVKEECFVFDFAPDRTLKVIAEAAKVSAKVGKTTNDDRKAMGEFLNFCPIIAVAGSKMNEYNVNGMLAHLKRAYVEKVVRSGYEHGALYNNDELMKLGKIEINEFKGLKKIIGTTKAMPSTGDIDLNKQGFTEEQFEQMEDAEKKKRSKKKLTEEEKRLLEEKKENKKQRDNAVSILRGISIRMPLLIYGADVSKENEDKEIAIDNFVALIDDTSWEEFMPKGVTKEKFEKFKKYYEPDVFRAAGKRIRAMARVADDFSIEERIERITTIFNTFRNPDKETVLTPWRVVNMHIGDCLGGYVFYDKEYENTISQPRFVKQGKVTQNVFDPKSKVLEINSKSGLYPLYVAYGIYRSRIDKLKLKTITQERKQKEWDKTLKENIFVICKTPMAKSITRRTLAGFRDKKVNAEYFDDLISQITDNPDAFIKKIKQGKTFWKTNKDNNMKFDAIVGNPPYQINVGVKKDNYGILIFGMIVDLAKSINPRYISMITPSRWFSGGRGLEDFRNRMLNDNKTKYIKDFVDSKDCFPGVDISGGINYFLWDREYNGSCTFNCVFNGKQSTSIRDLSQYDTFTRYNEGLSIINKVIDKDKIDKDISPQTPFGFITTYQGKLKPFKNSITLYTSRGLNYVSENQVLRNKQWIKKYKLVFSKATSEHAGSPDKNGKYRVLSKMMLLKPNEVCTQSYLVGKVADNYTECYNFYTYLKTSFVRILILITLTSQDLSRDKFKYVPDQDFTSKSDIDWSKPIPEIDKQLYKKYKLTKKEIEFIESMIKPMDNNGKNTSAIKANNTKKEGKRSKDTKSSNDMEFYNAMRGKGKDHKGSVKAMLIEKAKNKLS